MKKMTNLFLSTCVALSAWSFATDAAEADETALAYNQMNYNYNQTPAYNSNVVNQPMGQLPWARDYNEAVRQSQATGKPILLLITGTNWCGACMKLEREVLNNPSFSQAVGNRFVFLKVDVDMAMNSRYPQLVQRYGTGEFPTIVVLTANGQKLFTVPYQMGGAPAYIQQLTQGMNRGANPGYAY